jgi:hypothetical protein
LAGWKQRLPFDVVLLSPWKAADRRRASSHNLKSDHRGHFYKLTSQLSDAASQWEMPTVFVAFFTINLIEVFQARIVAMRLKLLRIP